jgi:hypothetical protein
MSSKPATGGAGGLQARATSESTDAAAPLPQVAEGTGEEDEEEEEEGEGEGDQQQEEGEEGEAGEDARQSRRRAPAAPHEPWRPTDEWLYGVKRLVPLRPVLLLIEYLEPLVERHVKTLSLGVDDAGVLEVRVAAVLTLSP